MDVLAACPANQKPVLKPQHNIDRKPLKRQRNIDCKPAKRMNPRQFATTPAKSTRANSSALMREVP